MSAPRLRTLFVIDGAGAALSAVCLGLVLPALQEWIGMPAWVLLALAGIAALFALNALLAYRFAGERAARWLGVIALLNLGYCALTGSLVALWFAELTALGVAYFAGEIAVILALVGFEGRALRESA